MRSRNLKYKNRDKTSINSYYKQNENLKKEYTKLLEKYGKLRSLLMSINHKLVEHFDEESDDERF